MIDPELGLRGLLVQESSWVLALSQSAAYLRAHIPDLNWCGYYLWDERRQCLWLGPFQGQPACTRIPIGKGVCGTAMAHLRPLAVPDVEAFPGHIACDSASRSELAVPVKCQGRFWGLLDLDSPTLGRFFDGPETRQIAGMVQEAFDASTLDVEQLAQLLPALYPSA